MAYVVLARKHRPLKFADVVGQDHVTRTLANAIEQDRVHHAYLLTGARGLGKTTTARIFAKALVCEQGPTAHPCNDCRECVAVTSGTSVDVIEIDGASNNSVDDVRALREQVHYLPQTARRKVYVIDEVHMLTTSAFNALLKTLEEPPAHVNFVFATTEPQKLPATILSRVSRLDFRRLSSAQLIDHLRTILEHEDLGVDDGGLALIARGAEGSVRDAMTVLDQVIAFASDARQVGEAEVREVLGHADRRAVADLVGAVLARDAQTTLARLDEIVAAGQDLVVLGIQVLSHLRDLVIVASCETPAAVDATPAELETLQAQVASANVTVLAQSFDRFMRVVDMLPGSRTQRLLVEMGLLELVHAEPMQPLGDLVARLAALDGGGSPSTSSTGSSGPNADRPARVRSQSDRAGGHGGASQDQATTRRDDAAPSRPAEGPATQSPMPTSDLAKDLWALARQRGVVAEQDPASSSPPPSEPSPPDSTADVGSTAATTTSTEQPSTPAGPQPIDWSGLQPFDAWERLLDRIRPDDGVLCAMLDEIGLVSLARGVVELAVRPGGFAHVELTKRPQTRSALEQAMTTHFGAPFRAEIIELEPALPGRPSLALMKAQRRAREQSRIEGEARAHPGIQQLLTEFEGELRSVRSPSDP